MLTLKSFVSGANRERASRSPSGEKANLGKPTDSLWRQRGWNTQADKLDDVINNGKVRCAVVLDFPPIGFRDANNEPAGFDVEYCKDLAKALDVDFELLPVTWAERLPSIHCLRRREPPARPGWMQTRCETDPRSET